MERLTSLLTFALLLGLSGTADGQTVQFTVAGDVRNPNTWAGIEIAQGESVYLRDVLEKAGAQGDGTAVILRGASLQNAVTEFVSAQMAGRGSQLTNGDVVVFHQIPATQASGKNILVITDSVPHVVLLDDVGNKLGDLLAHLHLPFSLHQTIPVMRTHQGSPVFRHMPPSEPLVHGDVVLLRSIVSVDSVRVSQLFGQITQTAPVTTTPSFIRTVANERTIEPVADSTEHRGLILPAVDTDFMSNGVETASLRLPVIPTAVETVISDAAAETSAASTSVILGNDPVTGDVAGAGVPPLWNVVFIFGLLGSVALIVTGWLRTQRESSTLKKQTATSQDAQPVAQQVPTSTTSVASTPSVHEQMQSASFPAEVSIVPEVPLPVAIPADMAAPTEQPAPMIASPEASKSDRLIDEQEWFGGHWRANSSMNAAPMAPFDTSEPVQEPELVSETVDIEESNIENSPQLATSESMPVDLMSPVEAADDLEDLIQNRLPVEVKQADLPLRVTLFGRPAGPRRLRIDAAHIQLAPPNFAAGSRSRQKSSQESTTTATVLKQNTSETTSLDRALNSLHQQGHE